MEDDDVPDTRVFVKGLPPHYTTEQLGAHFAGRYQITDSVVIPNRRIGFVGFRNYTLAKNAVKYFDKSYIRMSKISVELAQPVDFHRELNADSDHQPQNNQNKLVVEKLVGTTTGGSTKSQFSPYESMMAKTSTKRKRADGEEQNQEMKVYLDTMQSKSKSTWANGESNSKADGAIVNDEYEAEDQGKAAKDKKETKAKLVEETIEASEAERKRRKKEKKEKKILEASAHTLDSEAVVEDKEARMKRKAEKKAKKLEAKSTAEGGVEPLNDDASGLDDAETDIAQPEIPRSDNDWLLGKTSRVLDLLDPGEQIDSHGSGLLQGVIEPAESSDDDEDMGIDTKPAHEVGDSNTATTDDQSQAKSITVPNGRLFVRNLPFSTIEADLRSTFARYGTLVEVSTPFLFTTCTIS
jgi:multiple RNA-binding domain-containing protein 1